MVGVLRGRLDCTYGVLLATAIDLTDDELRQLTAFVRDGLLDERA